ATSGVGVSAPRGADPSGRPELPDDCPGSAEPPSTTNEPPELVPAARTKAPIASAIATAPTTSVDRPTAHRRVAGSPPGTPPGGASTGSSRTRHGVALGSTHRPPRRDRRATTPR